MSDEAFNDRRPLTDPELLAVAETGNPELCSKLYDSERDRLARFLEELARKNRAIPLLMAYDQYDTAAQLAGVSPELLRGALAAIFQTWAAMDSSATVH